MRTFRKTVLAVVALYAVLLGGLFEVMHRPIVFGKVMSKLPGPLFMVIPFRQLWFYSRAGRLNVGDAAPDFVLPSADRKAQIQLSAFRGKTPVVLIFGSYT